MQPIASWLVARPQNAIAVLAATLVLPLRTMTSGAALVLLILHGGPRKVAVYAAIAAAVVAAISFLAGLSVPLLMATVVAVWVPVGVLAALMRRTRSLTLTLQLSVMLALAAIVTVFVVVADPVAAGREWIDWFVAYFREVGDPAQADALLAMRDEVAPLMTIFGVLSVWLVYVLVLMIGYTLFRSLPGETPEFGRFHDLNFGRVIAVIAAGIGFTAFLSDMPIVQNLGIMCVAAFCVQGLAIMHWLRAERGLPVMVVIVAYVLLFPLAAILGPLFAVVGYTDAWFDLRSKLARPRPDIS